MIAHVDGWLPGATEPIEDWALNDITLERADRGKMVELSIRVDDVEMSSFGCDGVIVSTPTGFHRLRVFPRAGRSCAECEGIAIGAVGRARLFARPLIIGSGSTFAIDILDDSTSDGWICCDGRRQRALPKGTRIEVRESKCTFAIGPSVRRAVHEPSRHQIRPAVVGWREQARKTGGTHHGQSFPRTGKPESGK